MVWVEACYERVTRLVIIETCTINHRYIQKILPLALQDGQKLMGDKFISQRDGASAHKDQNTQNWCHENFWDF